tara:strand:+ start:47 stop:628 length:582 start_codon:yes stop_codon:yes gene_type:complete
MTTSMSYLFISIINLYAFFILLNFLFRLVQADYFNPLIQSILKITDPPISIFRIIIKPFYNLDMASLILAVLIQFLVFAIYSFNEIIDFDLGLLVTCSIYSIVLAIVRIVFWIMLLGVIFSWIGDLGNPIIRLIREIADSFFKPFRQVMPDTGMLDFSPILAFFSIYFVEILIKGFVINSGISLRILELGIGL